MSGPPPSPAPSITIRFDAQQAQQLQDLLTSARLVLAEGKPVVSSGVTPPSYGSTSPDTGSDKMSGFFTGSAHPLAPNGSTAADNVNLVGKSSAGGLPLLGEGGHSLRALPLLQGFVRLFEPTGEDVAHPMDAEPFIVSYPSQALEVEGFSARRNGLVLSPLHCEALAPAPSVKQELVVAPEGVVAPAPPSPSSPSSSGCYSFSSSPASSTAPPVDIPVAPVPQPPVPVVSSHAPLSPPLLPPRTLLAPAHGHQLLQSPPQLPSLLVPSPSVTAAPVPPPPTAMPSFLLSSPTLYHPPPARGPPQSSPVDKSLPSYSQSRPAHPIVLPTGPLRASVGRVCHSCGTSETPKWRKSSDRKNVYCNACGLQKFKQRSKQSDPSETPAGVTVDVTAPAAAPSPAVRSPRQKMPPATPQRASLPSPPTNVTPRLPRPATTPSSSQPTKQQHVQQQQQHMHMQQQQQLAAAGGYMDPSAMMGPPYYAMPMYNHMPMYFQGGYGYPPYYSPAGGPGPFIYSPSPVQHPHAAPPAAMPPPPPATSADSAEMLLISLASSPANGADGQYFADGTGVRSPKRSKLGATSVDDPTPPSTYERYAGPPAHDRYTAPPPSEGYTGLEALSIAASNTMA